MKTYIKLNTKILIEFTKSSWISVLLLIFVRRLFCSSLYNINIYSCSNVTNYLTIDKFLKSLKN